MSHNDTSLPAVHNKIPLKKVGGIFLVVVVVVVGWGLYARHHDAQALTTWTNDQVIPTVQLAPPSIAQGNTMTFPGHLDAWNSAPIHARTSGYLKAWYKDIGAPVKAGDVLATIDTPDLDQQYAQGKADLARYQADAKLADISAHRWKNLLASNSVSKQELDEKEGQAAAAHASVLSAQANVDRLAALESYKKLVAPFDGTVTARRTDIGDLIDANVTTGPELFTVSDTSKLRLYVNVPQSYSDVIKPGMTVELAVPEHPGKLYTATLLGSSGSVNQASGALLAQYEIDNTTNHLLPGDYADVHLKIPADSKMVVVPSSALLFRAAGPQIATVDTHGRVVLHDVHIALDLGQTLDIDQGLTTHDRVIVNPTDSLEQGDPVQVADDGKSNAAATAKAG